MKEYLVSLNRPLLLNFANAGDNKDNYKTVYGFFAPYRGEDKEEDSREKKNIHSYIGYLCAEHQWANNNCGGEFSISLEDDSYIWRDKDNKEHLVLDEWAKSICARSMEALGIDYTFHLIDLERANLELPDSGVDRSIITRKDVMDKLIHTAEYQANGEPYTILLFNRPIWVPKTFLWNNLDGYYNIYGIVTRMDCDDKLIALTNKYLGMLAMYEDYYLFGKTESGYKASPIEQSTDWIGSDGKVYSRKSEEIEEESRLYLEKYGLEVCAVLQLPEKDVPDEFRNDYLLCKEFYESWRTIATPVKDFSGCQNE